DHVVVAGEVEVAARVLRVGAQAPGVTAGTVAGEYEVGGGVSRAHRHQAGDVTAETSAVDVCRFHVDSRVRRADVETARQAAAHVERAAQCGVDPHAVLVHRSH